VVTQFFIQDSHDVLPTVKVGLNVLLFPWKLLIEIAPEETPAKPLNVDSPSDVVAVALRPSSKLIDLLAVEPPIEIVPDEARAIS
jgi:hypothetical protein